MSELHNFSYDQYILHLFMLPGYFISFYNRMTYNFKIQWTKNYFCQNRRVKII